MSLFQPKVQEKKDLTKMPEKGIESFFNDEVLLIGCDNSIHAFTEFGKYPISIGERSGNVYGFVFHDNVLYDFDSNGCFTNTLEDKRDMKLEDSGIFCSHKGRLYTSSDGHKLCDAKSEKVLTHFGGGLHDLCSHGDDLYACGIDSIYNALTGTVIGIRGGSVQALFSDGKNLYDCGEYEGIWNTFKDSQEYSTDDKDYKFGMFVFKDKLHWINQYADIIEASTCKAVPLVGGYHQIYRGFVVPRGYFGGAI